MKLPMFQRRRVLSYLAAPAIAVLAAGLVGCASGPSPAKDREVLLQRAQEFWKSVQDNDSITSWKFEEVSKKPGWTLQAYLKREGILYETVQVQDVHSLEGDRAIVNVKVTYSVPLLRLNSQEVVLKDEWVRLDGLWYHADRKSLL
ncbi:hypothetical protein [Acidovorax sp.]|uniref:hypothetical protein n=1 Tax=Acidovorax sp. TaxID=1872122 RepID=UPI0025BD0EDD|nr:hypothetical protein [Acidovorax sp.]MBL7088006.1 hypothetical protein [Acidovorax sp.]